MPYTSLGLEEGPVNVSGDSTLLFGLLEEEPSTRVVSDIQFVAYGKSGEGMFTATREKTFLLCSNLQFRFLLSTLRVTVQGSTQPQGLTCDCTSRGRTSGQGQVPEASPLSLCYLS